MRAANTMTMVRATAEGVALAALLVAATSAQAQVPIQAIADIEGCSGEPVYGVGTLTESLTSQGVKEVTVSLQVEGLAPNGRHAVHIHENAACEPCSAAGGHFDPGPASNSSPDGNHPHHAGDLVNLEVDSGGFGVMQTLTSRVTLSPGPNSLFDANGSAFIVHVDPDSYCPDGATAGCAGGARAACGINRLREHCEVRVREFKIEDDKVKVKIANDGDERVTASSVEVVFPPQHKAVREVKFAGKELFKGYKRPPIVALSTPSFPDKTEDRQIKPGDDEELEIKFDRKYHDNDASDFFIKVFFSEACQVILSE